jgi:hypothetical protein
MASPKTRARGWRFTAFRRNAIDPAAEDLLKAFLHAGEVQETDWLCEFSE